MTLGSHLRKDARLVFRDAKGLAIALALPAVIIAVYSKLDLAAIAASGRNPDAFILVISTTIPALLVASTALVAERRQGTFSRLSRSPANILLVVASKTLVAIPLIALQVVVILVAAVIAVAGAPTALAEHTLTIGLVLLLAGTMAQALGVFVSAIVGTETQATQLASLLFLVMFTLSGFLQELSSLGALGAIAGTSPMALGYAGVRDAMAGASIARTAAAFLLGALVLVAASTLITRLRR